MVSGCGKNPNASSSDYSYERVVHAGLPHSVTKVSAIKPVAAAKPVGSVPFTSAVKVSPAGPGASALLVSHAIGTSAVGADQPGSLALAVNVSGTAVVASLALDVLDQLGADALQPPLPVANGLATWQQASLSAGTYALKLKALGPDGAVLGQATTQAIVKPGEPTEVTIDLRVNAALPPAPQTAPMATSTQPVAPAAPVTPVGPAPATTSNTVSTQSTGQSSSQPATGGTLGLNLDIQ
jgi:hypothetical protein